MTVSADVSVMPRPPARVPSRNTGVVQPGASNRAMAACRAAPVMSPSRRSYLSHNEEKGASGVGRGGFKPKKKRGGPGG